MIVVPLFSGCNVLRSSSSLPSSDQFTHGQLVVHSDFRLPRRHRLLDELTMLRSDIAERLQISPSDEPINVYLFDDSVRYESYIREHHPDFPYRRAFFVKNDTELNVYAFWGEKVGEDLRHEVTHGYLHSVVSNLPLWLDEGLAEFHEVQRGHGGHNSQHIELLVQKFEIGEWKPDLAALDQLIYPTEMTQLHYAEAWLWTHFMLQTEAFRREYLRRYIAQLVNKGEAEPLPLTIMQFETDVDQKLIAHMKKLHSLQQ